MVPEAKYLPPSLDKLWLLVRDHSKKACKWLTSLRAGKGGEGHRLSLPKDEGFLPGPEYYAKAFPEAAAPVQQTNPNTHRKTVFILVLHKDTPTIPPSHIQFCPNCA